MDFRGLFPLWISRQENVLLFLYFILGIVFPQGNTVLGWGGNIMFGVLLVIRVDKVHP